VQITRRPGERNTDPPSDRRDQRKPKTAIGRILSKNSQPRLTDLALNDISTGHSPTPVYLHEPATESLCLHQQRQTKKKEQSKKHTTSTSTTLGGKHSDSPKGSETKQPPLGQTTQGGEDPSPNGQGYQNQKNKTGRRRREASSPPDNKNSQNPRSLENSQTFSLFRGPEQIRLRILDGYLFFYHMVVDSKHASFESDVPSWPVLFFFFFFFFYF
jgi:hypothetical protein